MELEFDKEIDAILRKARAAGGTSLDAGHLDADTIAAFAENALPTSARSLYVEHLADCGRCRKLLSESIVMNRGADAAAASTVLAAETIAVPWYSRIFRTPSLAIAMGSLVLVFTGALGFVLLQRQSQNSANSAILSRAIEPEAAAPYSGGGSTAVNTAAPPAIGNTNAPAEPGSPPAGGVGSAPNTSTTAPAGDAGKTTALEEKSLDDKISIDGTSAGAPALAKPPAPASVGAPLPADQPKPDEGSRANKDEDAKEKTLMRSETRDSRSRMDREAMPEALKKAGPARAAGPLQGQANQTNNAYGEMSVTRSVGGRTFANRNGAWIDTSYSGQAVTLIRRGSDDFKKLDGGLRSIANELYGTVIVVWKGRAYRVV